MNRSNSVSFAVLLVSFAAMFIILWGIRSLASVLNPILLAAIITIVVMPVPQKLSKRGLPDWLSFVVTLLAVVAVIALVLVLVFGIFTQISTDASGQLKSTGQSPVPSDMWVSIFGSIVRWAGGAIALVITVLIIFIFMLSAAITMPAMSRPGLDASSEALTHVSQLFDDMRSYMSITTAVNLLVGLGNALLLWVLGVPFPLAWGLFAWVMGYIPTVGFWIAMIPPLLLAWSTIGPSTALIVFLGYVLINGSVENFVKPRMMGEGLGISPVIIFISLIFWTFLLGGVGAILAVPMTMIVLALLAAFPETRWVAILMSVPKKEPEDEGDRKQARATLNQTWSSVKQHLRLRAEDTEDTEDIEDAEVAGDSEDSDDSGDTGDATEAQYRDPEADQQTDEIDTHITPNS